MGTIFSLKQNGDKHEVFLVGTDINPDVVGMHLCDKFYRIPSPENTEQYLNSLRDICLKEQIDIILPQNTRELHILAQHTQLFSELKVKVIVSNYESIINSNNKFNLMGICRSSGIPVGDFQIASNKTDLLRYAEEFGWPRKRLVVKPPVSNGQRGVRIIDDNRDLKYAFYNEKPSSLFITMADLINILGEEFPELILTEYLQGAEYTVDVLRKDKHLVVIPRKRDFIRSGITFNGSVEYREDLIDYSKKLANILDLEYCFGFQFKLDGKNVPHILETNPRVQGTMVLSTVAGANIIFASVLLALGESIEDFNIDWNAKLMRYWGGVGISNDSSFLIDIEN